MVLRRPGRRDRSALGPPTALFIKRGHLLWSTVIDVVRATLFTLAHWCGGSLGAAILLGSLAVRAAMIPLSLRAARRRRSLASGSTPALDPRTLIESVVQLPPAMALYAAIRSLSSTGAAGRGFLWIVDLARPDRMLAVVASLIAAGGAWLTAGPRASGAPGGPIGPILVTAVISFLILSHLSAGLALYSVANSVVGAVERRVAVARPADGSAGRFQDA